MNATQTATKDPICDHFIECDAETLINTAKSNPERIVQASCDLYIHANEYENSSTGFLEATVKDDGEVHIKVIDIDYLPEGLDQDQCGITILSITDIEV